MKQKHFMDIERISFGNELKESNVDGFHDGDIIQISEKIDGSNASVRWDTEENKLQVFSRKQTLNPEQDLNGFYEFTQALNTDEFKKHPNWVVFGEWLTKHTVKYPDEYYNKWYVYDIYDVEKEKYLPQKDVKKFCQKAGLKYINVYYEGPFTGWDNVIAVASSPSGYGAEKMEGVVIKNQTRLNDPNEHTPFVVKYVNPEFAETKHSNHMRKVKDPNRMQAKSEAEEKTKEIVTAPRVRKEILKMQDENMLPDKLTPKDMSIVARFLPDRIYDDCVKEEKETVNDIGEYFRSACRSVTMSLAKQIILGE